jgi:hypothetical protein
MDRDPDSNDGRAMSDASNPRATADRLRCAVSAATAGTGSRDELQQAARALADELRGRREPPEQVLIQIKALLADAGIRFGHPATDGPESDGAQAALYRDIITWSIRAYYEDGKDGTNNGRADRR